MNEQNLFELVDKYYNQIKKEESITWDIVATMLNNAVVGKVNYTTVPKTGQGWRKWHRRAKRRMYNYVEVTPVDIYEEEDSSPPQDIVATVWATTNLDQANWDISKVKTWGKPGALSVSAIFSRKQVPANLGDIVRSAIGPVNWPHIKPMRHQNGKLLFVPTLFDAHLGKLGNNISDEVYLWVLADMLAAAERQGDIGQVLFILGHDFGHVDNTFYATTGGTDQEVDDTYQNLIRRQTTVALQAVRYLAERYPTAVQFVPGNHDRFSNAWLGQVVEHTFENHPNVTVDNTNSPRKYYKWQNVLLMSTHGSEEKLHNLVPLISSEARQLWGTTKYCEVLTGHLHTQRQLIQMLDEDHGIVIRYMPSLSGADNWHILKGYLGNNRGGLSMLYDGESGWLASHFADLDQVIARRHLTR